MNLVNDRKLINRLILRFSNRENPKGYEIRPFTSGYFSGYELHCDEPYNGSNHVLDFRVWNKNTGVGKTAAAIAEQHGTYYLLHTGDVNKSDGREPATWSDSELINGTEYYVLGPLSQFSTFENICKFHESRLSLRKPVEQDDEGQEDSESEFDGYDPGNRSGSVRKSCICHAHHHPICKSLMDQFNGKVLNARLFKPDLFVEKDGTKYLFEVKPDNKLTSIYMAMGQIQIYSAELNPHRSALVCESLPCSKKYDIIKNTLRNNGIHIVEFERRSKDEVIFRGLENLIDPGCG